MILSVIEIDNANDLTYVCGKRSPWDRTRRLCYRQSFYGGAYISRIAFKLQFRLMLLQIPDLSHPS